MDRTSFAGSYCAKNCVFYCVIVCESLRCKLILLRTIIFSGQERKSLGCLKVIGIVFYSHA